MTAPRTPAGRALLADVSTGNPAVHPHFRDAILAIEAEAGQAERKAVRLLRQWRTGHLTADSRGLIDLVADTDRFLAAYQKENP